MQRTPGLQEEDKITVSSQPLANGMDKYGACCHMASRLEPWLNSNP